MRSKVRNLCLLAALTVAMSGSVFAGKQAGSKQAGSKHIASGTITSIDSDQVVISEKVKGKEQPMTFKLDASTQKSGSLKTGAPVTVQYRTENKQNLATAVRETTAKPADASKSLRPKAQKPTK